MSAGGRDELDVEALRTDRYLDALLAAADRHALDVPADAAVDPHVRAAARRLASDLARLHPSFRFEERLGRRLAEAAREMRPAPLAVGGAGAGPASLPAGGVLDRALDTARPANLAVLRLSDPLDEPLPADVPPDLRPYLIGGALTSAALSIAGAAWVAWRRTHQPVRSPMRRAVRAARHARHARLAARLP